MNHESLNRGTQHVIDVYRIKTQFESMSAEEVDILVFNKVQDVSMRWALCRKSFRMLFTALNRGNGPNMPQDSFDIRVGHEMIGDTPFDTYVRVCRERKTGSFIIRPFTRTGIIESHEYESERFDDSYSYRYGTYHSRSAKLSIDHDTPEPTIRLDRVEGGLVSEMDTNAKATFMAAMATMVDSHLGQTEESLMLITSSAMDPELNPTFASKFQIEH